MSESVAPFKVDGEMQLNLFGREERSVGFVVDGGVIPLEVGATFICRVVSITREVVER